MKIILVAFLWNVIRQQVFQEMRVIASSELYFHELALLLLN